MTLEAVFVVGGVIATVIGVAALAARLPARAPRPASRPRPARGPRPSQQLRIERIVDRSAESGLAVHTQLRPLLREIAQARLDGRGLRIDRDHGEVRSLLGADVWELVRPDRSPPSPRAPGIAPRELEAVLDRLEAL